MYDEIKGFKYISLALINEDLEERSAGNNNADTRPKEIKKFTRSSYN